MRKAIKEYPATHASIGSRDIFTFVACAFSKTASCNIACLSHRLTRRVHSCQSCREGHEENGKCSDFLQGGKVVTGCRKRGSQATMRATTRISASWIGGSRAVSGNLVTR